MSVARGSYILDRRPGLFHRVDGLLAIGRYAAACFSIAAVGMAYALWTRREYDAATSMFVFSSGITAYVYSTLLRQQIQVTEYAAATLGALQDRWDQLRLDDSLLEALSSDLAPPDVKTRIKLRLYLASVLDVLALVVHYIRRGYFRHTFDFAMVYEGMIRSLFEHPQFVMIWRGEGTWGPGKLREEFGRDLVYVIDCVVRDLEGTRPKPVS